MTADGSSPEDAKKVNDGEVQKKWKAPTGVDASWTAKFVSEDQTVESVPVSSITITGNVVSVTLIATGEIPETGEIIEFSETLDVSSGQEVPLYGTKDEKNVAFPTKVTKVSVIPKAVRDGENAIEMVADICACIESDGLFVYIILYHIYFLLLCVCACSICVLV